MPMMAMIVGLADLTKAYYIDPSCTGSKSTSTPTISPLQLLTRNDTHSTSYIRQNSNTASIHARNSRSGGRGSAERGANGAEAPVVWD